MHNIILDVQFWQVMKQQFTMNKLRTIWNFLQTYCPSDWGLTYKRSVSQCGSGVSLNKSVSRCGGNCPLRWDNPHSEGKHCSIITPAMMPGRLARVSVWLWARGPQSLSVSPDTAERKRRRGSAQCEHSDNTWEAPGKCGELRARKVRNKRRIDKWHIWPRT